MTLGSPSPPVLPDLVDEVERPGRIGGWWSTVVAQESWRQGLAQDIPQGPPGNKLRDDGTFGGLEAGPEEEADVGVAEGGQHGHLRLELMEGLLAPVILLYLIGGCHDEKAVRLSPPDKKGEGRQRSVRRAR